MRFYVLFLSLLIWVSPSATADDDVEQAIQTIGRVGPGAAGSRDARTARDQLAKRGTEILPRLLVAMDTTNIVAANWYRTAFDTIAERELARPNGSLPQEAIAQFVRDSQKNGRARRLGLALLERLDPTIRARWMPDWLADSEFRRDAVDHVMQLGDRAKQDQRSELARELFERAFQHARDSDQVLASVMKLKSVGQEVDPIAHLGFVTRWWLVGPFPAQQLTGFRAVFPPEMHTQQVDLSTLPKTAEYESEGRKLRWKLHQTDVSLGEVNLIQAIGAVSEAVGYAFAELESSREQTAQLRCSADDNLTVWLNGAQVLAREQWLNGTRLDRFIAPVTLKKGRNQVLVKVCQGPQHVNPEVTNNWTFQLRFCDETGRAAEFRNVLPAPE